MFVCQVLPGLGPSHKSVLLLLLLVPLCLEGIIFVDLLQSKFHLSDYSEFIHTSWLAGHLGDKKFSICREFATETRNRESGPTGKWCISFISNVLYLGLDFLV